jgi:CTP synthase
LAHRAASSDCRALSALGSGALILEIDRYEVNTRYRNRLEGAGLRFSGLSPDGLLPEIVEIPDHPWFIGVQFHPELKSRPFEPHPLFASFIGAAVEQSRLV